MYPGRAAWAISNCCIQLSELDEPNDLEPRRFGRRLPRLHSPPVRGQHASKAVRPLQDLLIKAAMSHYKETIMNKTIRYSGLASGALLALSCALVTPVNAASANSANNSGPYDPPSGSVESDNGNGGGNHYGRPKAGEVGKADAKNPNGQRPGPDDDNNGYECDGNSGIAKGNPAHSGCIPPEDS